MRDSRYFQLKTMSIVAFVISPLVWFLTIAQGFPFPMSISETAAIGRPTSMILPYGLGVVGVLALMYGIKYNYDFWDRWLPISVFAGFTIVALFPLSETIQTLFGLSQRAVDAIHYIGAILGFLGAMLWVLLCFTKSNGTWECRTKHKKVRDIIYVSMGASITMCIPILVLQLAGQLHMDFAIVFWLEAIALTGLAVAFGVKGRLFRRQTKEDK